MRDHSLLFRREFVLLYELALTGLYVNTKHRVGNIKKNHTYYPYRPLAENYSYNMNWWDITLLFSEGGYNEDELDITACCLYENLLSSIL